ncbi:hypothetical protein SSX86_023009 [Deinandra increscens subsp. villosa]|uniref:RNA-directed DNA polymerase, eukaryota, Reverse transcriptase zinc-binding domain protein n=1 Tax=Deinandra increscens subsp. villosa TaxID=3103831 RepID=A0AAP0GRW6_9ASTR
MLRQDEIDQRLECKRFILEMERSEQMDLQQKARSRWAMDGDENSRFFHGLINANTKSNRIRGLHIDGNWVTVPSVVKGEVFNFFSNKFLEPHHDRHVFTCPNVPQLSDLDAHGLVVPFTMEEIKNAVWWNQRISSPALLHELNRLCGLINSVRLTGGTDRWLWEGGNDAIFSAKSIKMMLHEARGYGSISSTSDPPPVSTTTRAAQTKSVYTTTDSGATSSTISINAATVGALTQQHHHQPY